MDKEFNYETCTIEEFWMYVAANLKKSGFDTILVGGGVATIYSDGAYMSGDIDLVMASMMQSSGDVGKALNEMGFNKKRQRSYSKEGCRFTIDVSSFPVTIGEDYIAEKSLKEAIYNGESVKMLSSTDCILDRLNKAYHYADETAFDAAVEVAKRQPYKIERIKEFCHANKMTGLFDRFIKKLSGK
jgi:hypothetical protein